MNLVVQTVLTNAAFVALLALPVWGLSTYLKRPAVTHALWILLLFKLLTPPLLHIPLPWHVTASETAASIPAERLSSLSSTELVSIPAIAHQVESPLKVASSVPNSVMVAEVGSESLTHAETSLVEIARKWASSFLITLWGAGCLLISILIVVKHQTFARKVRRCARQNSFVQSQVDQLAKELGLRTSPTVMLVEGILSPMLCSLGVRVTLLFPQQLWDTLTTAERRSLLTHELAHYQRRDHWVRFLEVTCRCLYWWHPVVWWASKEIARAEEECCDAFVIRRENSRTYADAIMSTLDFISDPGWKLPPLSSGMSGVPELKTRLTQIMSRSNSEKLSQSGRVFVVTFCLVTIPLYPFLPVVSAATLNTVKTIPLLAKLSQAPETIPEKSIESGFSESPSLTASEALQTLPPAPTGWWSQKPSRRWATIYSPDRQLRMLVETEHRVFLESLVDGKTMDLSSAKITSAAFRPASESFVTGSLDGTVHLWHVDSEEPVSYLGKHSDRVTSIAVDTSGHRAVSGSTDGSVIVWDIDSGALLGTWTDAGLPINSVRFSPTGDRLAVSASDWRQQSQGRLVIVDLLSFEEVDSMLVESTIATADFSGSDSVQFTTWNGERFQWDLDTRSRMKIAQVSLALVKGEAFSPDATSH